MDTTERTDAADSIRHEVSRCKKIVQRMSTPDARVHALGADTEPWTLVELGDEQHATGEIPVEVSFQDGSEDAPCDLPRDAIGQILRELLANAAQACRRRKGERAIRIRISASDAVGQVQVQDDGEGMDTALAGAAFDPFFSTKPEGSGMGLGLYLTRAQLRQLGGSISVESKPGHGTTVTINFPLAST